MDNEKHECGVAPAEHKSECTGNCNWEYDFLELLRVYDGKTPDDLVIYVRALLAKREKDLLEKFMIYLEKMENIQFPDDYPEGVWFLSTLRKYVKSFRKELSDE